MGIQLETIEDARQMMEATVVYYDGKPLYLGECVGGDRNRGFVFRGCELPMTANNEYRDYNVSDPLFRFHGFQLGYMNPPANRKDVIDRARFLERVPLRQYRQGLSGDAVWCGEQPQGPRGGGGFNFRNSLYNTGFRDMLVGTYPTFDEAIEQIKSGKAEIIAFHKDIALGIDEFRGDINIFYRGNRVGWSSGASEAMLPRHFEYLKEVFELSKLKVRIT